ncbi:hypothetical protein BASA81_013355 [Batrachochytrium salamandrivorans]|nr:hypothetical protein BASA81_013355 [Batrachochytrium salamandrivorans]
MRSQSAESQAWRSSSIRIVSTRLKLKDKLKLIDEAPEILLVPSNLSGRLALGSIVETGALSEIVFFQHCPVGNSSGFLSVDF